MRRLRTLVAGWLVCLLAVGVQAAPATGADPAILARDEAFAIVRVREGDSLESLASRYLGDAQRAWRIAEFNRVGTVNPGQVVIVPLKVSNPFGVHPDGYQTVPILCYHRFGNGRSKLEVSAASFEAQLAYLANNHYQVITLAQLEAFLQGREPLPRQSVVITIDDGYRSTYEVAFPLLRRFGFPATVFLYSDFVGARDALSWAQMREMQQSGLVNIEAHSKTHSNLSQRLADEGEAAYRERMRREVEAPVAAIGQQLDHPATAFAYPYGDASEVLLQQLQSHGIALGLTVTPGGNGFFAPPHLLHRTMVFGDDDLTSFAAKLPTFTRTGAR